MIEVEINGDSRWDPMLERLLAGEYPEPPIRTRDGWSWEVRSRPVTVKALKPGVPFIPGITPSPWDTEEVVIDTRIDLTLIYRGGLAVVRMGLLANEGGYYVQETREPDEPPDTIWTVNQKKKIKHAELHWRQR